LTRTAQQNTRIVKVLNLHGDTRDPHGETLYLHGETFHLHREKLDLQRETSQPQSANPAKT